MEYRIVWAEDLWELGISDQSPEWQEFEARFKEFFMKPQPEDDEK